MPTERWKDPNKLQEAVNDYFSRCKEENILPIFPELLLHLDITRNTWDAYIADPDIDNDKYNTDSKYKKSIDNKIQRSDIIKKAQMRLEAAMTREAAESKSSAPIFFLKQKFYGGYTDKQEIQAVGDVKISVKLTDDKGKRI